MTPPDELPKDWVSDEAFIRSTAKDFRSKYSQILNPELWLPLDVDFYFEGGTLASENQKIGATFGLKRQLERLHAATAARLAEATPPAGAKNETLNGAGKIGLDIFLHLANLACEHRLPMLLNF
ncbi:MAG: hypothetical protein ACTHN5_07195 [Phycisphaerae bacterium]